MPSISKTFSKLEVVCGKSLSFEFVNKYTDIIWILAGPTNQSKLTKTANLHN